MVASKVNAFIASLDVDSPHRDLAAFFEEAARALGFSADADLARAMAVSPVTFASWKRRGKMPPAPAKWFQTVFPEMVFNRWRNSVPSVSNTAVAAALATVRQHYGEGLDDPIELLDASSAFCGLLALIPAIANTHVDIEKDEAVEISHNQLVLILTDALAWRARQSQVLQ